MPSGPSRRIERINELLRDELSELIRRELKDPRVAGIVTVTEVEAAPDLSAAKVFVSVMGSEEDKRTSLKTLRHAARFFRHMLIDRLHLRRVPDLDFRLDLSIERGDRLMSVLRELEREQAMAQQEHEGAADDRATEEQDRP
jgi:ribosome-binding factor A